MKKSIGMPLGKLADLQATAREIDGVVRNSNNNNFGYAKYKIEQNNTNVSILVSSDSTGNASNEFVYYFTQWLGQQYTTHTTKWYEWDTVGNLDYSAPVTTSNGSGSYTINVFSVGVGGTRPAYMLGTRYNNAAVSIVDTTKYTSADWEVSAIILNHSHNVYDEAVHMLESRYAMLIEPLLLTHPNAGVVCVHQNPWRDSDTDRLLARKALVSYASRRGFDIADVNKKFYEANKSSALYGDNVHPTTGLGNTGTQLFLDAVAELFSGAKSFRAYNKSTLDGKCTNLIEKYGKFSTWTNTSTQPDGYNATGITSSKDTTVYEDQQKAFSWKCVTTGSGQARIDLSGILLNEKSLYGKWVTLSVRYKAISGVSPNSPIRLRLGSDATTTSLDNPTDDWCWISVSHFFKPSGDNYGATFYVDAGTPPAGFTIYIDRIVFSYGRDLKDSL